VRIHDLNTEDGRLRALEVTNTFLSRGRACRIVEKIPGAQLVRKPRLFRDSDAFCEFTLAGGTFFIEEPFGDNSRYWIGSKGPTQTQSSSLLQLRAAFARHNQLKFPLLLAIAATVLVVAWLLHERITVFLAQDRCLDSGGRWEHSQRACSGTTR
jgi:hypothetical protein